MRITVRSQKECFWLLLLLPSREDGCMKRPFSLLIGGLLRIGEVLAAFRRDLVLPSDAAPGTSFALLQIKAPKTRGRAARHQASHIDPPDVISLLERFWEAPP